MAWCLDYGKPRPSWLRCHHRRNVAILVGHFSQLRSSIVNFLRGTTNATLGPSPTRLYLITPVLPPPCGRRWDVHNTTTSSHGFPDNDYRAFINPPCQKPHVTDIPTRSCTCSGEDHPGPSTNKGRGAPEIDVFEAERNKTGGINGIVSQSAQFAPFTHDYLFDDSTPDKHTIYNPAITVRNTYRGSAV